MAQATKKSTPEPGKAVVVRQVQELRRLPERIAELQAQKHFIETVESIYETLMIEGVDYGIPKDTNGRPIFPKPMLYKSGAELLRLYLDLQLRITVDDSKCDYSIPILRYRVSTDIYDKEGRFLGSGEGVCSSMEGKYRYRWVTAQELPADVKAGMTKTIMKDGVKTEVLDKDLWINTHGQGSARWTRFGVQARIDSPDIFDQENTILSQAKKRSLADGIKTVTGASRIFLIGQEAIQAAASIKVETPDAEIIDVEAVEQATDQSKQAEDFRQYQEQLKDFMIRATFTLPDGKLDLLRFKDFLMQNYKVENISQLDATGRQKLLNQMADLAIARESK